ncbi:uncharacterized protein BO66DRAFT_89167 [Aspergillus aculeatinus CBS 121060]|uniref:Uncharacterized protein n=1 Tax=Aspergillus aculeatinus CBS 121060 TaxID=1448322 RepID=A0ACD1H9I5_9EURO|nr:hypothetical protein BO66DRAFT_89167 [Aspergillus aculeatinus CBS 121060]RAH70139.1 hypothetical protein BO66DRAFT_89167 [Aspergillus aculeatinus CBS 121060]
MCNIHSPIVNQNLREEREGKRERERERERERKMMRGKERKKVNSHESLKLPPAQSCMKENLEIRKRISLVIHTTYILTYKRLPTESVR